jgi:hypothetical protein
VNIQEIYQVVEALMAMHNLCIDMNDHSEDIMDFDPTDNTESGNDGEEVDVDKCSSVWSGLVRPFYSESRCLRGSLMHGYAPMGYKCDYSF